MYGHVNTDSTVPLIYNPGRCNSQALSLYGAWRKVSRRNTQLLWSPIKCQSLTFSTMMPRRSCTKGGRYKLTDKEDSGHSVHCKTCGVFVHLRLRTGVHHYRCDTVENDFQHDVCVWSCYVEHRCCYVGSKLIGNLRPIPSIICCSYWPKYRFPICFYRSWSRSDISGFV